MVDFEEIYRKWKKTGKIGEDDITSIVHASLDEGTLEEFLSNKIEGTAKMCQILETVAFTDHLLRLHGSLIGVLQRFITSLLNKLERLAKSVGGILFHIEVGPGIHVSITFQVSDIATM